MWQEARKPRRSCDLLGHDAEMRPTLEKIADARRKAQWFLATMPDHSMADTLRTFLEATAPVTKEEAIPVLIQHANEAGDWPSDLDDEQRAQDALNGKDVQGAWDGNVIAQMKTLVHFMGGAE